jgi:hypothetical protein
MTMLIKKKSGEKIALTLMITFAWLKKVGLVCSRVGAGAVGATFKLLPAAAPK